MKRIIATASFASLTLLATAALAENPAQPGTARPASPPSSAAPAFTPQSAEPQNVTPSSPGPAAANQPADIPAEGSSTKHRAQHGGKVDVATGKEVQTALKSQGLYDGPINGVVGKQTKTAIAKYQKQQGWPVTAQLDKKTLDSLKAGGGTGTSGSGSSGATGETQPQSPEGTAH